MASGVPKMGFMRTELRAAALLLLAAGLAMASGEKFAGTWEATAKGHVFLILKVSAAEKISGTLNAGKVKISDDGELEEAGPVEDHEAPIFFAEVDGDKLKFEFQDEDGGVMSFELKLTGDGSGELRIVDKDRKFKPFSVKRVQAA
jgi:hypothetical protein